MVGLTSHLKHQEIAGLLTSTTPSLLGGQSVTGAHISSITDSIILLRYVEIYGEMRRGLTVLNIRGSFRDVSGILAARPQPKVGNELDTLGGLFEET